MQNPHNEPHPVELLLFAGLALLWALATAARLLVVPLLAALVALLTPRRQAPPPAAPAPAAAEPIEPPATLPQSAAPVLPLAELAAATAARLQPLTVAQLRALARAAGLPRALSHTGRRVALLEALGWAEVALI